MRNTTSLFILSIFFLFNSSFKTKAKKKDIVGEYQFNSDSWIANVRLILKADGTFFYNSGGDLMTYNSNGNWTIKEDTIVLNSNLRKNEIPIKVVESRIDTNENFIHWSLVKNTKGDALTATIALNCDSNNTCEPLMYTNCKSDIGTIDSFYILFDNSKSVTYYIKNKKSNKIDITTLIDHTLWQYQFLVNEQFIMKNKKLYRVSQSSQNGYDIILSKQTK